MHLRSTFPKSHKQSLETSPTFRKQIIRIYNFYNWIYVRRNSEPTNASIKQEKIPLTSVFWPRFRRSAIGISAIEAEIMVKRMVRLEIGILESPRYRISACYLVAFFRGNSPLAIAATCVTKRNNDPISHCKAGLLIDRSIDRSIGCLPVIHDRVAYDGGIASRRMLPTRRCRFRLVFLRQKQVPQCYVPGWTVHHPLADVLVTIRPVERRWYTCN